MNLAKRILQGEQLTKETVLKIYEDTNIDTLDLLNEAYILRNIISVKSKIKHDFKCQKWDMS